MCLVTVIIPYFKKKKYIQDTINTVVTQTYKNLEIIIIYDDTDMSDLNYLKEIAKSDNRIIIIKNNNNLGAGLSRNEGIKKSSGEYIAFLDADDLWHKEKISKQIYFMKQNYSVISHTSYSIINDKTEKIVSIRHAKNFNHVDELLKSCDIGLSTVMLKKNTLLENNIKFPNLKTKEDFVLWLMFLIHKNKIFALKENLMTWRKSKNSLSSNILQKILDGFKVYNVYMEFNFIKSTYYLICLSFNYLKK
tara:strand:- start:364 stop:1110 length:747 start_codon:yes stop_codon:yes gene_type:complete